MEGLDKLSSEEKETIKKSWKVLEKNLNTTAYNIFEMIFRQSPDTKQLFPFMKIHQGTKSREMEFHGLRFLQVLESVVKTLHQPASLNPLCDNLGRVHGRLSETRGFRTHHWGVFIECTLFHFRKVLSQDHYFNRLEILDKVIINWRTILRLLIRQMKNGFNTDIRNRAANKDADDCYRTSASNSPVNLDGNSAPPQPISHSLTLPVINSPYRKLSESAGSPDETRSSNTGILRPLRDFARKKLIPRF